MLVDHLQPLLGHGRGTMHHEVRVGDRFVNLSDSADCQHFTGGFAGEFVSTMAGTDRDGQRVALGFGHEIRSFCWICQQHVLGQLTFEAMAVFSLTLSGFQ